MKTHLLHRESITPIARYLARRGELPDSADRQLEFAAVLLYRERHAAGIDAWLETREPPHAGEAAAFFWLRAAGEELG